MVIPFPSYIQCLTVSPEVILVRLNSCTVKMTMNGIVKSIIINSAEIYRSEMPLFMSVKTLLTGIQQQSSTLHTSHSLTCLIQLQGQQDRHPACDNLHQ